jgi:hypothetical protein
MGTSRSAKKRSIKTLHEFTSHIPPKNAEKEHKYTPPQKSGQDFAPAQVENAIMRRFY